VLPDGIKRQPWPFAFRLYGLFDHRGFNFARFQRKAVFEGCVLLFVVVDDLVLFAAIDDARVILMFVFAFHDSFFLSLQKSGRPMKGAQFKGENYWV
jgi:hypothetical protein